MDELSLIMRAQLSFSTARAPMQFEYGLENATRTIEGAKCLDDQRVTDRIVTIVV